MMIKTLCVYCGANTGQSDIYAKAAQQLAYCLVKENITLVYGGACVGIMGILADTVLNAGGKVIGVIPQSLVEKEVGHSQLTQLHITQSMHERKALMAELSDGFIAMPGGIGTLDELFEIWTWGQLGFHHKPCGILNVNGYFDLLIQFLDKTVSEGFLMPHYRSLLMVENTPDRLLNRYQTYQDPQFKQWLTNENQL